MQMTAHALKRWNERFRGMDYENLWEHRTRVGVRLLKRIRKTCPNHLEHLRRDNSDFYYYKVPTTKVIFVCTVGDKVVTVFEKP